MRNNSAKRYERWPGLRLALVLLLAPVLLAAQSAVTFESGGPSKEVPEGSRFEVSFSLKNAVASRFIAPDFKGLRITGGPSEMRGAGFINGRSYSHQSWTYELEAGAPGTYTIGPATVQTSSQTLRSEPLVIRVGKARTSKTNKAAASNDQVFVSAELNRETAWLGEQVFFQIKLYTQISVADFDILDLPPLEGFFAQERRRFDTRTQYQTIRGKRYAVRILYEMSLYPQQAGELIINPARVRVGVEQSGGLGALLGAMPVMLQTQPVKLNVKPLPEPEPVQFSGGVGHYRWKVQADKDSLTTDDALTLSVEIEGDGDARSFAAPRFMLPGGLEGFEPKMRESEEFETGDAFVHRQLLEYAILPRQPGVFAFIPELVVFDPDSNQYRTLRAEQPVTMTVTAGQFYGKNAAPVDTIGGPMAPQRSPLTSLWDRLPAWVGSVLLWGSASALLAALLFWWLRRQKRKRGNAPALDTRRVRPTQKALRERFQEVFWLMQSQDSRIFYHELLKAIQAYVAFRLGTEPTLMTREIMQEQLLQRQVPEATVQTLIAVWQNCEQAVFAGLADPRGMNATWQQAEAALQQLDAAVRGAA